MHCSYPAWIPTLLLKAVLTLHICALLLPQCSTTGALSPEWGLPESCQEQCCGTVRQCLCPMHPWHTCSWVELWSCPKKKARDAEVLCLQPAFLYKLPLGRIFCPAPWAGGSVPWGECLLFGSHWFLPCLSFSHISYAWLWGRNSSL